jgi:hypothetical protein
VAPLLFRGNGWKLLISNGLPGAAAFSLLLAITLAGSPPAQAEPRYTAMYGQNCTLCHANPAGGGMRTLYASQYIVPEELAMARKSEGGLTSLNPEVTPGLVVGADLRTLVYQQEGGNGSAFSMQGDLYVQAQLSADVGVYFDMGQSRAGEIFGLAHVLPLDGYVKAGRFIPDHGWKWADHQMFNRRYLYNPGGIEDPSVHMSSGIELGISPGIFLATASVLDGTRGDPSPSLGDNYAAKAMIMPGWGPVNLGVGASIVRRTSTGDYIRSAGGLWYLGVGPVAWVGQIDETKFKSTLGNLVAQELTVRFLRGADLRFTYGFQDPDRANKTGARHRVGGGVAVMPAPFFSVQLMFNQWFIDEGPDVTGPDYSEAELMAHFFF